MVTCAIPAQFYLFLVGAIVGGNLFGTIGAVVLGIGMFFVGKILGFRLARHLWDRLSDDDRAPPAAA
jgi:membrane protein DedA with SNARE-associated domain